MYDGLTLSVMTFYFLYFSRDWFKLCFVMTIAGAIGHIFMLLCAPESPRWLLMNNRK